MPYERGWFEGSRRRPGATRRLVCLPFAGGGSAAYRAWPAACPPDLEVLAVQPPGRGGRHREAPIADLVELADRIAEVIAPELTMPTVLFGHSQGAWLAFETVRSLARAGAPSPVLVVASACPPLPYVRGSSAPAGPGRPPVADLDDDALVEHLRRLGGTPPEVLAHPELLALVLPAIRADFTAGERYRPAPAPRLDVPLLVLGAGRDALVASDRLPGWGDATNATMTLVVRPDADHFSLLADPAWVLGQVAAAVPAGSRW